MRFFPVAAAVAPFAGFAASSPVGLVTEREANKYMARQVGGLAAAMIAAGREYIGISHTIRNDNSETNITRPEFNSITPENAMKWDATEPNRGNSCFNNETLQQVMESHINNVMGRWKGKCTHRDLVNEALNEDGTYRDNVFLRAIGEAYLPISFRMAAKADPDAKLYYDNYNPAYGEAKAEGAARIVKPVQDYGEKIDGIGPQGHTVSESTGTQSTPTPSREVLANALRMFTDLGVDVAYTEMDIRMNSPLTQEKLGGAG
ncbi:uncharacterized protein MKZ38_010222 [Zalerion maritima]|uniref:endo-1,4-beta-xylanase n=1 Tax=Zalerion maritima TaxID=339359 RepID=A0AAD5WMX4_9PEZI|nr:uncharacterized protein MKZ38_010222 [Zalerion maritima]